MKKSTTPKRNQEAEEVDQAEADNGKVKIPTTNLRYLTCQQSGTTVYKLNILFENTLIKTNFSRYLLSGMITLSLPALIARQIIGNLMITATKNAARGSCSKREYSGRCKKGLHIVQHLDPIGVGARDLKEFHPGSPYGFAGTLWKQWCGTPGARNHNYQELQRLKSTLPEVKVESIKHFDPLPGRNIALLTAICYARCFVIKMDGDYKVILDDDHCINPLCE